MKKNICKYCGNKTSRLDVCSACVEKLKRIRKIQAMVRNAKEEVERDKARGG